MTDTTRPKRYRMVSKYYKETYGEKVYKLPVALPLTCPNRDGSAGVGGCTSAEKLVPVMKIVLRG